MKKARNIFWALFVISLFVTGLLLAPFNAAGPEEAGDSSLTFWVTLITAVGSFISAITASIITLRRDRLEARKSEIELAKMQLDLAKLQKDTEIEIAKKQRELDELQRKDPPQ